MHAQIWPARFASLPLQLNSSIIHGFPTTIHFLLHFGLKKGTNSCCYYYHAAVSYIKCESTRTYTIQYRNETISPCLFSLSLSLSAENQAIKTCQHRTLLSKLQPLAGNWCIFFSNYGIYNHIFFGHEKNNYIIKHCGTAISGQKNTNFSSFIPSSQQLEYGFIQSNSILHRFEENDNIVLNKNIIC